VIPQRGSFKALAISLALAGTGARAQGRAPALANGLYEVVSSGGAAVRALDGSEIRLDKLKRTFDSPMVSFVTIK
jgi:hypothetical protein